jgi:hypothetical protein
MPAGRGYGYYIIPVTGNGYWCGFNIRPAGAGLWTLYPQVLNPLPSLGLAAVGHDLATASSDLTAVAPDSPPLAPIRRHPFLFPSALLLI